MIELAASDAPKRKFEDMIEPSQHLGQSPEHSSMHPFPHGSPQSEASPQREAESQSPLIDPVRKNKRKKGRGRKAQSAEQGHSKRKAQIGNGLLQRSRLRWEFRRKVGVKLKKIKDLYMKSPKETLPPRPTFQPLAHSKRMDSQISGIRT